MFAGFFDTPFAILGEPSRIDGVVVWMALVLLALIAIIVLLVVLVRRKR